MCSNNGDPFIATLNNVLLAPDLCDRLFSIITSVNLGYTCLFQKGFCMVYFGNKEKIQLLYHIVHRGNMHVGGVTKQMSKSNKIAPINKVALELLHHILGQIYTISLMAGDAANVCQDI